MLKKWLITFSIIAFIPAIALGEAPLSTPAPSEAFTTKDEQMLGHILVSIQPYLTEEEKQTLSNLIKEGIARQVIDLGKKTPKQAGQE